MVAVTLFITHYVAYVFFVIWILLNTRGLGGVKGGGRPGGEGRRAEEEGGEEGREEGG
jgi:hypothetical protein